MRIIGSIKVAACASLALASAQALAQTPVYKDPSKPVEARVDDLLRRMTLEEKVAQIMTLWQNKTDVFDDNLEFDPEKAGANYPHGIGQIARPSDRAGAVSPRVMRRRDAHETVALINAAQKWAIENTRLGIPILFHEESLHGYAAVDATSFPQAIALASTWDPALVEEVSSFIAGEVAVRGVQLVLSPVVDVARDPRWGRIEETFGEDPYLVGEISVAAINGLQGEALPLAPGKVLATLKHMTGHGQPESGTNVGPAQFSERVLREVFFPSFEEVVRRTNILAVMASYNEIDGVPSHANSWLLNTILRGEWGFKGAVVSDYFAIEQMADIHKIVPDYKTAAALALKSGVDVDLPDGAGFRHLVDAVREGLVSERDVDRAVRRFLTLKFQSGVFERPYADADVAEAATGNAEGRALALKAARAAPILLKNDGLLPLSADRFKRIAVIGPNANVARLGGYSGDPRQTVNVLEGVRARVGDPARVLHAEGVRITDSDDWWADEVNLADPAENRRLIREAVRVARGADIVVLVLGDTEQTSREGWAENHLGDRTELTLPGQQDELAEAIFALRKPTAVVLLNGRPPAVTDIAEKANALIEGWYLGQEGGTAMAEVLFGDVNPGGKLPVTIARNSGQLPMFYNMKPSARRGYLFDTTEPLYPFGYGLSYTTFEIGEPRLSQSTIARTGSVEVLVDVTNTGDRKGDEVVQLYIRDLISSVTRPIKELKGFERVTLEPGETRTLTFTVTPRHLHFWNIDMKRVVEPGDFDIMVGPNSVDLKTTTLTVR